jgi:hypothetical protein
LQRVPVAKKFVPELYELRVQVTAVDVGGGGAVGDEMADFLAEAAAQVEELGAVLYAVEDLGVGG